MPDKYTTEMVGLPSGQIMEIYSVFVPFLYLSGYIIFNPNLDSWAFRDEEEDNIKKVLKGNLCMT